MWSPVRRGLLDGLVEQRREPGSSSALAVRSLTPTHRDRERARSYGRDDAWNPRRGACGTPAERQEKNDSVART